MIDIQWDIDAIAPSTAEYIWGDGIDYALSTHNLRPWTERTMDGVDFPGMYEDAHISDYGSAFETAASRLSLDFIATIDDAVWPLTPGRNKRYRGGRTWEKITDSGALRDSMELRFL